MLGSASIFDDINAGFWDDGLDAIIEMAVSRRNYLRKAKGAENQVMFKHGDAVRLINISPKYLIGVTGRVNKDRMPNRAGDLMIDIDEHHYSRISHRFSRTVGVPASSLERV